MKHNLMKQAFFGLVTCGLAIASIGLLVINTCSVAQASPQLGGDCHYCHQDDQPDALALTGYDEILDEIKVFDVEPGGSVDLGIAVVDPGQPEFYRTVLRGLDTLNGVDEAGAVLNLPLLYTPDPSWDTKSPGGAQYLFWETQFYGAPGGLGEGPMAYNYYLEISPDVEPGLYDLTAYVGGGIPVRSPGQTPSGGWNDGEEFQLRVVPEPTSVALLLAGAALFCLGSWRRKRAVSVVLVVVAGLLMVNESHAYPSRGGDCAVCHSRLGPSRLTGDFEINDADGNPTTNFTVEAGEDTEFLFKITRLVEDHLNLNTYRRGYFVVDGLDLLNVDAGPPPAFEDIPYSAAKYTFDHDDWHYVRGAHRYIGPNGQYYAQSSTDPAAELPFPLTLDASVAPGIYDLTAKLAGGRPSDEDYLNGWTVAKYFTLTVLPYSGPGSTEVPEPGTLLLLACAFPAVWLSARRRRRRQA